MFKNEEKQENEYINTIENYNVGNDEMDCHTAVVSQANPVAPGRLRHARSSAGSGHLSREGWRPRSGGEPDPGRRASWGERARFERGCGPVGGPEGPGVCCV